MKKIAGFSILGMMIIIWVSTLVGYGIRKVIIEPSAKVEQSKQDNTIYNRIEM